MPLRILLLGDNVADAELTTVELQRHEASVNVERVDSRKDFVDALTRRKPDVVLSDHGVSQFNAVAALAVLNELRPSVPLIVLSGAINETMAAACAKAGAQDVIHKRDLGTLPQSIARALSVRRPLEKLTARQLQVFHLIAEGKSATEIGVRLNVSEKTVENHRTHIMTRLDLHDAASVVRFAARLGLIGRS